MKILKKAEQKNFVVKRDFYTVDDLFKMYKKGYIECFDDDYLEKTFNNVYEINREDVFRVFVDDINEIKVVYVDEYGFYANVVVMNSGEKIFISLD